MHVSPFARGRYYANDWSIGSTGRITEMRSFFSRTFARTLGLLVLVVAIRTASAEAVKDLPRPTDYVSDFANVLSPKTQEEVNRLCGQVDRQAHAQIAVVTIKTLDGEEIQSYSV